MAWKSLGERLETTDLDGSTLRVHQKVIFNRDMVLRAIRSWFIQFNNPTWSTLGLKIYSNRSSAPGKLLYTSETITKAEMFTLAHGKKEVPFAFNDNPLLRATDSYYIVPFATGYTGSESSHLAWRRDWPKPVYTLNVPNTWEIQAAAPFAVTFIGADI